MILAHTYRCTEVSSMENERSVTIENLDQQEHLSSLIMSLLPLIYSKNEIEFGGIFLKFADINLVINFFFFFWYFEG